MRKCGQDYKIPETDSVLEKDTNIFIPVHAIHRDPEFYPNPEVFDPERFSDDGKKNRRPFTYLPFGEGPRNCIGTFNFFKYSFIKVIHMIFSFFSVPICSNGDESGVSGVVKEVCVYLKPEN